MANAKSMKYMIMASNMPRAIEFYERVFGLNVRFESEHWSELDCAGVPLALHIGEEAERKKTGLSLEVESVAEALQEVVAGGGKVISGPTSLPNEGIVLGDVLDSEGNEIMISSRL